MRKSMQHGVLVAVLGASAVIYHQVQAQDVADPLTIQGLDQWGYMSARARGMGGSTIAVGNDVGAMFANPATLARLAGPEVRVGGYFTSRSYSQTQQWVPNRFYAGLSLMFEDLLDGIKDPEPLPPNPADRVQRAYDDIPANWNETTTAVRPSLAAVGVPFVVGDVRVAAAVGVSEAVHLDTYFQNNNALSPNIGSYRPSPIPVVTGTDSMKVHWYQFTRQRTGAIHGVTPAVSVEVVEGLSLGASGTILFGSSDDFERSVERGLLTFFYDKFRSDSIYSRRTVAGTSTYTGVVPMLGGLLTQETFSLGVSVRLPMEITRYWERTVQRDTTGATSTAAESGNDKLELPLIVAIGGTLSPSSHVDVSVDYEMRRFGDVRYTPHLGETTNPWLSGQMIRAGIEYRAATWLAIRGGYRQAAQSFAAAGAPLLDEPVLGTAYTAGIGVRSDHISVDLAYEFARLRYEDSWQSNVNINTRDTHTVWLETGYRF